MAEVEAKLAPIIAARGQAKACITRLLNYTTGELSDRPLTELVLKKARLQQSFDQYEKLNIELSMFRADDQIDEVEGNYFLIMQRLEDEIAARKVPKHSPSPSADQSSHSRLHTKLPPIEIPKFSGQYREYRTFMALFNSMIGDNSDLDYVHKLYYLRALLEGEPLRLIENLSLTADNYNAAIIILEDRYNNKFQIISEHITCLLDISSIHRTNAVVIREFISNVKQQVAALQNLGLPVRSWDAILVIILCKKLDLMTNRAFQLERDPRSEPKLSELISFLEKRAMSLELADSSVGAPKPQQERPPSHYKPPWRAASVATAALDPDATTTSEPVAACPAAKSPALQHTTKEQPAVMTPEKTCAYCKLPHKLFACPKFQLASQQEKHSFVTKNHLCKTCLNLHKGKCRYHFKCSFCKGNHNTLLHSDTEPTIPTTVSNSVSLLTNKQTSHVLLPTAKVKLICQNGKQIQVRALLDTGSQVSFITDDTLKILGYTPTKKETSIIGITHAENKTNFSVQLDVHSIAYPYSVPVECHIVDRITMNLPQYSFDTTELHLPAGLQLADDTFNVPGEVQMLMGADIFFQILLPTQPEPSSRHAANQQSSTTHASPSASPRVVNTLFGHIVAGNINVTPCQQPMSNKVTSLFCQSCETSINENISNFWKTESIPSVFNETKEQEQCEKLFRETVQLKDKKFQVAMPLKLPLANVNETLGNSFNYALKRFLNLEKRFSKNPKLFEDYKSFIQEYLSLGHGSYIDISQYDFASDPLYFLPHQPVINEDSKTTKLRVVFDGSMPTNKKISLNDILLNGPVVQRELFEVLLLFRVDSLVFVTDIRRMFRNIEVDVQQAPLQNILWRDSPDQEIKCIQLKTVTYGLKSSSYLATRCLKELADRYRDQYPKAAFVLDNSCYVDDILVADNNLQSLLETKKQLSRLLSLGSLQLHKWASNAPEILAEVPIEKRQFDDINFQQSFKTLGVNFNINDDSFKFTAPQQSSEDISTKRQILSFISKFYDPLGLIGPIFVKAKVIIQKLWEANVSWDSTPPTDLSNEWQEFMQSIMQMETIVIPRNVSLQKAVTIQIVGFADAASSAAYGCCVYLRIIDAAGSVKVSLLSSKSRVNPLKKPLTIPRLELNAALLLAKLAAKIHETLKLKLKIDDVILHSDSQVVLSWIKTDLTKLDTYVANRVKVILQQSAQPKWIYIKSAQNPADCLSRGIMPHELSNHPLWWQGPSHLHDKDCVFKSYEYSQQLQSESDSGASEQVSCPVVHNDRSDVFDILLERESSATKMVRVLAYIIRFCCSLKKRSLRYTARQNNDIHSSQDQLLQQAKHCADQSIPVSSFLTTAELNNSLLLIIQYVQGLEFQVEIKALRSNKQIRGCLEPLHVFIDKVGTLRVGGRLQNAMVPYTQRHPAILPKNCKLTDLIIREEHYRLLHAGQKLVASALSQKYYIINAQSEIKEIISKCVTCFRLKAIAAKQLMGSLPSDRVNPSRPFEKVGVDYCGPISVKQSRVRRSLISKGYVAVFVCFVTKAIHLELVSDLRTDTFLACFKRFIARRNKPTQVYCDNASTFKGAKNQLDDLYKSVSSQAHQSQVQSYAANLGITFNFIPSYSPVFGGLWEASVKSTKHHLKRVIERAILTYEELNTVLVQIEGVLNSRPLTPMSPVDKDDFSFLTPGHFLTGAPLNSYPEQDVTSTPTNRLKFWKLCTSMQQQFWKVWSRSYLNTLQNRPKWRQNQPNITPGMLVLLVEINTPSLLWPTARVTRVFPGSDGKVRALEVITPNGNKHTRSVTKVCILPIDQ